MHCTFFGKDIPPTEYKADSSAYGLSTVMKSCRARIE